MDVTRTCLGGLVTESQGPGEGGGLGLVARVRFPGGVPCVQQCCGQAGR